MKKIIKSLNLFSKISFWFAFIVALSKLFLESKFNMTFANMHSNPLLLVTLLINVVFNVFLFTGAGLIFKALAQILENQQKNL